MTVCPSEHSSVVQRTTYLLPIGGRGALAEAYTPEKPSSECSFEGPWNATDVPLPEEA
jgi:hypothetical protein